MTGAVAHGATWRAPAIARAALRFAGDLWRAVEAQHVVSTMALVDTAEEQAVLEDLLEDGKPPLPAAAIGLHHLLFTPFRYRPPPGGSRFRGDNDPGVFYAADEVRTACAELGYWRWRFLRDAVELERLEPVAHTAFRAELATAAVDLRTPPFAADAALWTDPADYRATQAFARVARDAQLGAVVYRSVRDPEPAWCVAVLTPHAFATPNPESATRTWWLAVQQDAVVWRRASEAFIFAAAGW